MSLNFSSLEKAISIDLSEEHLQIVQHILKQRVPQYDVWAFGSRVTFKARKTSDLDLAIITDKPLDLGISADLREDFSQSDLPMKVDFIDWATTSSTFKALVEKKYVEIQKGVQ